MSNLELTITSFANEAMKIRGVGMAGIRPGQTPKPVRFLITMEGIKAGLSERPPVARVIHADDGLRAEWICGETTVTLEMIDGRPDHESVLGLLEWIGMNCRQ